MLAVPPHVLNWLYNVLRAQYQNIDRTYQDVVRVLNDFSTLKPRTDTHTLNNGQSALLLLLDGVIPVQFQGQNYNFPVNIWVPHSYPREPPMIYVVPTKEMLINPGQHVDSAGQFYHPYLSHWYTFWDKSTVFDLLTILRDVFAKEPPVKAKSSRAPPQEAQPHTSPPPIPPLPQDLAPRPASEDQALHLAAPQQSHPVPPPLPPKANGEQLMSRQTHASSSAGQPVPPIPPKPLSLPDAQRPPQALGYGPVVSSHPPQQHLYTQYSAISQYRSPKPISASHSPPEPSRYDTAPPFPPQVHGQHLDVDPLYTQGAPQALRDIYRPSISQNPPPSASTVAPYGSQPDPRPVSAIGQSQPHLPGGPPPLGSQPQQQPQLQLQPPPPQPKPKAHPLPDIMDTDDMQLAFEQQANIAPPPIPPNPEKDMLLHQLAKTLHGMRLSSKQTTESSLAGLDAQKKAMADARLAILSEIQHLTMLSQMLQNNTGILLETMRQADEVIESSRARPPPEIDSLLIAPSLVATQLYNLVAEERALGDAIFMLGRAVEKGHVAPNVFARNMRSLARDWFLKKALIKKIGRGMGLSE